MLSYFFQKICKIKVDLRMNKSTTNIIRKKIMRTYNFYETWKCDGVIVYSFTCHNLT